MDLKGKDNAPQYNANEHFQIFYVVFYFLGGIITLNFFVSIMLINYRRAKESFSGEKHFTYIQKQWLSIKTYIYSLKPQVKTLPSNQVRRGWYRICSHQYYRIFQLIVFVSFLIRTAFYSFEGEDDEGYWQTVGAFVGIMLIKCIIGNIGFGYNPEKKKFFILGQGPKGLYYLLIEALLFY